MYSHSFDLAISKLHMLGYSDLFERQYRYLWTSFLNHEDRAVLLKDIDGITVSECPDYEVLNESDAIIGRRSIHEVAILKLNGGLGTTMGCDGPKSLIPVTPEFTFLDIIFKQVEVLRHSVSVSVPLYLMDSFATHEDTKKACTSFQCYQFLQHQVPRLDAMTFEPISVPNSPDLEWAPPGHGDVFWSIYDLGILDSLLKQGIKYLFISNSDNLGATFDTKILGMLVSHNLDMIMEVSQRTALDVKGGAIVKQGSRYRLLERAQVQKEDISQFEDVSKFSVFNTNSIWINLDVLLQRLKLGKFELPVIANPKTIEGRSVIQLEMAMGSAIEVFDKVSLLKVPKSRFLPVKKIEDLMRLRSAISHISTEGELVMRDV